jgi:DNA adenine methylase
MMSMRWSNSSMVETRVAVRPILKWAGGKRQLLPRLRPYFPRDFSRYVEPFLGSAAVFLDLHNDGALDGREVQLSDINRDVIGCYRAVRDDVDAVIAALERLAREYLAAPERTFYAVRDERFNPARQALDARRDAYGPDLAAMLIFLNRTGYNGLFRLNARGDFNVPMGRHANPRICDAANLRLWSAALGRRGVSLTAAPFDQVLEDAGEGDFVYLDPPYAPLSATSRFTAYTAGGFGPEEQAKLQQAVIAMAGRGAQVLLSNSSAAEIRRLYATDRAARRAGLTARTVPARRAINSRASARGPVSEYLITNLSRRA